MAIKLQCVCKKVLTLPDSLTGQKVRCKDCGKVMLVPAPAVSHRPATDSTDDPLAVRGHRRCSGCGRSYPATDQICTGCGLNMDTGAQLYVSLDEQAQAELKARADAERNAKKPGLLPRILGLLGIKK